MKGVGVSSMAMIVGKIEEAMEGLVGVDFLVNACGRAISGFKWYWVLERGIRVVRSVFLPVGQGLDISHISIDVGVVGPKKSCSRWI
ncbi:hypothetical protein V6N11_023007 [Hibiscus sabdariffa]|uniref:Uncharacterized protein n=1 Tax=Hibiscus sabdariffa TaxID=183260 RepID=A0ABR2TKV7_9ROSI